VLYLISSGADIAARNRNGSSLVHITCHKGLASLFQKLVNLPRTILRVLDLELQTELGIYPIHCAAENGHVDIARILISQSVNLNSRNHQNRTALHYAAINGHLDMIQLLVEHDAYVNARDDQGYTPLLCACAVGDLEVVTWFAENGGNLQSTTDVGNGALHLACKLGNSPLVKYLLGKGLDRTVTNNVGLTPVRCVPPRFVKLVEIIENWSYDTVCSPAPQPLPANHHST